MSMNTLQCSTFVHFETFEVLSNNRAPLFAKLHTASCNLQAWCLNAAFMTKGFSCMLFGCWLYACGLLHSCAVPDMRINHQYTPTSFYRCLVRSCEYGIASCLKFPKHNTRSKTLKSIHMLGKSKNYACAHTDLLIDRTCRKTKHSCKTRVTIRSERCFTAEI